MALSKWIRWLYFHGLGGSATVEYSPYKRKLTNEEAIQMIINGDCGVFSKKLLQSFIAATKQPDWIDKSI